ncbi:antigen 5 like allergen Cul n 1-like [Musca vetustissima]|uniref:antigen 5 like allergen Cul n 1-like n=1 Tax=Musca vetustissima TaxID=27455 RepID=UPI002AB66849|nr:antigen 5 like allergen Cul n 1-like [Musca vetustissima]
MKLLTKLLILTAFIGIATAVDYCSPRLCRKGLTHIACNNNGTFSTNCPADATISVITPTIQDVIVSGHNEKRNFIAGGGDANHLSACRMATMQWNTELASMAELNVRKCTMQHDKCRNTNTFLYSGQNLITIGYYGKANVTRMFEKAMNVWYDEVKYSNMDFIQKYPANYNGKTVGHFTVMMADRNVRVGCAAAQYSKVGVSFKIFLIACNYATTNMIDFPIYANCSLAASGCVTGKNPQYPNLCSIAEGYKVNTWF